MRHEERGQDTVEYAGMLAIIAVVVGAILVLALPSTISHAIKCSVYRILQLGSCDSSSGIAERYPVSVTVKTVGWNGRFAFVNGSDAYTVKLTTYNDGTTQLSTTDLGSGGVGLKAGFHAEAGTVGVDATATASADLYGASTIAWNLPNTKLGQKYYNQLGNTSGVALAGHDLAGSLGLGGLFDAVTGTSGPPTAGSLPHRYLNSAGVEGGVQGNAAAEAEANLGIVHAGASVDLTLSKGLQRINSGSMKGDWVLRESLDVQGSGGLAAALFGPHADISGAASGEMSIIFSPSMHPLRADLAATADGTWDAALSSSSPSGSSKQLSTGEGSGSGASGNEQSAGAGEAPELTVESNSGKGAGTTFLGEIDLQADPQAAADVGRVIAGDPTAIPTALSDFNNHGTETIQHFQLDQSNEKYGAGFDAGVGVDGGVSNGTATMHYQPPQVRQNGGPWHTGGAG